MRVTNVRILMLTLTLVCCAGAQVRGKAMSDKSGDLVSLVRDILLGARLDDQARFKQMVEETKAMMETSECCW